jgi:hypothetical protein
MKALKNGLQGNRLILLRTKNEGMVVTVWTSKVTVRKEKDGTELSFPIDKRGFQKTFDFDHRCFS